MAGKSVLLRLALCSRSQIRSVKTIANINTENGEEESNFFSPNFKHPYKRLFPWKTLSEFADELQNNIVYNDGMLVVINKPWGVGIYRAQVPLDKRQFLLQSDVRCNSKFCVADALELLSQRLNFNELRITKSIDRNMSGIMLLTTDEKAEKRVKKSLGRVMPFKVPYATYWCITKGYPLIKGPTKEYLGIKEVEVDEEGHHLEPEIVTKFSIKQVKKQDVKTVHCEINLKSVNKQLATAVVEISSTTNKYNFVRTYATFKTSFILGDVRMAARIRQVLGVPFQVSPHNVGYYDDYEPLPKVVRDKLFVLHNRQIPLMIHCPRIILPMYKKDKSDLIIESNQLPHHFLWTLQQLDLM